MRFVYTIIVYILFTTLTLEQGSARELPLPHSKNVESGMLGSGMNNTVERVTGCNLQVIGTQTQHRNLLPDIPIIPDIHVLPDRQATCYQACATVTYIRSSGIVFYDDEGYPMQGTETKRTKREAFQVCGRQSCDGSDVYSSCEAYVQPYVELCMASGFCSGYDGRPQRQGRSSRRNPYYNRATPVDPDFEYQQRQ